jgi:hypothetical protein
MSFSTTRKELTDLICTIAKSGIWKCYPEGGNQMPYTLIENGRPNLIAAGNSIRYALISQIGISRWLSNCPDDRTVIPSLWPRIMAGVDDINHIGDLALLLWAAAESSRDDCGKFAEMLIERWPVQWRECNAVELGWVVQSLVRLSEFTDLDTDTTEVLKTAYEKLTGLYNPDSRLFARHNRVGFTEKISRRIACFADQVYPILALANYGRHFQDARSVGVAVSVADTICRLQGPKGQWWWHYDVQTGKIAEQYPIFSVHQHGMAPMALFAVDAAAGTNHKEHIVKGVNWLVECNELTTRMIEQEQGVIWRDIHRREIGKMFRIIRGLLITNGLTQLHRLAGRNLFGYVVNRECRPYELGWLLYAWGPQVSRNSI